MMPLGVRNPFDLDSAINLTSEFVTSYAKQLRLATTSSRGCDPVLRGSHARQFFLGNGGCWSVAYTVADNLRTKLQLGRVSRVWHPHDIAGAISIVGFASSFNRLLDADGLGEADIVHLVSGSGRSANLVDVVDLAAKRGATVLAHCGHDGGLLRQKVSEGVQIVSFDQQIVEDALLLRLWPGHCDDQGVIDASVAILTATLRAEIPNLADVAIAIAEAVVEKMPIGVVALDVAAVSASAEHVAHNLSWDMCWDAPEMRPKVHFALSNGLLTAVANDSGVDAEPFEQMLLPARPHGIVINLGRERVKPPSDVSRPDLGISKSAFQTLCVSDELRFEAQQDLDFMCAAFVQMWGHVLIRVGRALVLTNSSPNDYETRLTYAQRPIAPRMERDD
jgi:phosphoheptose isomerase